MGKIDRPPSGSCANGLIDGDGDGVRGIDRVVPEADEVELVPLGEDTGGVLALGPWAAGLAPAQPVTRTTAQLTATCDRSPR